ncbi:MAG: endolytic transglycosylase MltG [Gordonia sp. (in: high G+C Gram-positive bacteria)]|uniref:endolytic transglycosylase MltG n=1 Tax=Gordonia sp. (in: high G+C Gram-positive bacteria) TaxID=84139 RepID=UPI003BB77B2A
MSDHRKPSDGDAADGDSVPIDRFVTDSGTRHRRRREAGDPSTTGSIPIVRTSADSADPMIEYRHPEQVTDRYIQINYATQPHVSGSTEPAEHPVRTDAFAPLDPPTAPMSAPVEPELTLTAPVAGPGDAGLADVLDEDDAQTGGRMPARRRGRRALIALAAIVTVLVVAAVVVLWKVGVFAPSNNFDSATGDGAHALIEVPADASLTQIGQRLTDVGVVGSSKAFVNAADGRSLSVGFYLLPTGISGEAAVTLMADPSYADRVGRFVVPEGLQLDSKKGVDGKTTPGVFAMIAAATTFELAGTKYGVTVSELQDAAANGSTEQLGVPSWAQGAVKKLTGDHRRIEGLIASGAWEDVDPRLNAREMLKALIVKSAARFDAWGLHSGNHSGLLPYDTLVVASIVEREVSQEGDYPKVARVILNRLDKEQKLQMDSTANYTAEVTDIDVKGEAYTSKTEWNTYQRDGLPVTPIGAVGQRALQAVENPAVGNWLYFVTVDNAGTTLFANTFAKHKANRQVACTNKVLTTGC